MIFKKKKKRSPAADKSNLLMHFPANSRYAESFRTLRTNLFFSSMEKQITSVVVTSPVEKEGKTNTAVNLAYAIAQADSRVLVLDCDLRRPYMTSLFSWKGSKGVTSLVTDVFGIRLTKGTLDEYSISDILMLTKLQQRTCRVDIENRDTQAALFFEKGRIKDILWKNRPDSKKLVTTLIRENLITEKQAKLAVGTQKKSVKQIGTILYTMGFVEKQEIIKALSTHTIEAIRAVSAIKEGEFAVSTSSVSEESSELGSEIDFEKIYADFALLDENLNYIKNSIKKAIHSTEIENLYILPADIIPPNPSELIGSSRMEFLVQYLKKWFDFIVIDTPPVMPATDALLMAPRTDGTILVVKSGNTDRKIVRDVIEQYKNAQQPIIGTVLNQVDMKKEGYYRYYSKYYSAYYGKQ